LTGLVVYLHNVFQPALRDGMPAIRHIGPMSSSKLHCNNRKTLRPACCTGFKTSFKVTYIMQPFVTGFLLVCR